MWGLGQWLSLVESKRRLGLQVPGREDGTGLRFFTLSGFCHSYAKLVGGKAGAALAQRCQIPGAWQLCQVFWVSSFGKVLVKPRTSAVEDSKKMNRDEKRLHFSWEKKTKTPAQLRSHQQMAHPKQLCTLESKEACSRVLLVRIHMQMGRA